MSGGNADAKRAHQVNGGGTLIVVAYHYVRDLPHTRFPRIKGLMLDTFRQQVVDCSQRYEMTTLDGALDFLRGRYRASRDLCLLTFDDGLKEHYTDVVPVLMEHGVQGCFFPATECLYGRVATVHKIHFLMAALELADYRQAFLGALAELSPSTPRDVPAREVAKAYPWDTPEVGALKYLANFTLQPELRDEVVNALFAALLGDEAAFADELYVSWDQLREMQAGGMVIGGHSHRHPPLASLARADQASDLTRCAALLRERLRPQTTWPFAYPYGSHDTSTIEILRELQFACSFTVESGPNGSDQDPFRLRRFDTNQLAKGWPLISRPLG